MKPLQLAPETLAQLQKVGQADVVDANGRVVGRVVFEAANHPAFGITDEELERRVNDPSAKWIPAAEVERRLRSRLNGGGNV